MNCQRFPKDIFPLLFTWTAKKDCKLKIKENAEGSGGGAYVGWERTLSEIHKILRISIPSFCWKWLDCECCNWNYPICVDGMRHSKPK